MSKTVQQIKSNKIKFDQHKNVTDDKSLSDVKNSTAGTQKEQNLELADDINLVRVSVKSKVSLRHLARQNYVLEALKKNPVIESFTELYKVKLSMLIMV